MILTFINKVISNTLPFERPWGNYALTGLSETQTPNTINWWPQTMAWQILSFILLLFVLKKIYLAYKKYRKNVYRRNALAWLTQLALAEQNSSAKQLHQHYRQLPVLLRQVALVAFQRANITQLSGNSWELWLDRQCSETHFEQICPTLLHQLAFAPDSSIETITNSTKIKLLVEQITLWVKHHRSEND